MFQEVVIAADRIGLAGALSIFVVVFICTMISVVIWKILIPAFRAHMSLVRILHDTVMRITAFLEFRIEGMDKKLDGLKESHDNFKQEIKKDMYELKRDVEGLNHEKSVEK